MTDAAHRLLAGLLEARTGQQLGPDRRWRVETALGPLIRAHGLAGLDQLAARVAQGQDATLTDAVLDALLNNETSFFRDRSVFQLFADRGLARLREARADTRRLAIWSAGCSTGQEAYSLAMLFAGQPARWDGWRIDIVASDVSPAAIAAARVGSYSHFEIQRGLPTADMVRWFNRDIDRWRAAPALRDRVRFEVRSLLGPAPAPGRFDAILCRNVLFYFPAPVRRNVFTRLASAIRPDGVLMLGAGETVMGESPHFVSDYEARGLYRPTVAVEALARAPGRG